MSTVLSLTDASFGYPEREVMRGLNLDVEVGEVVAILGPNGSGKSTVVKGVLGLAEHTAGTVSFFGQPLSEQRDRTRVGYVPQRHTLATSVRATVQEIVAIGRVPRVPWWAPWRAWSSSNRGAVREAIDVVGLGPHRTADVATLSGGQQRRVLIARALAARPEVYLLDEPTAGVDVGNQRVLAQVLGRLVQRGATLIIVTHELEALRDIVTRAVVLRDGVVTYDGPPEEMTDTDPAHHHDDHLDDAGGVTGEVLPLRERRP